MPEALHIGLGGVPAVGVDRHLAADGNAPVPDPAVAFTLPAEAEALEREEHRWCEVVVDLRAIEIGYLDVRCGGEALRDLVAGTEEVVVADVGVVDVRHR